MFLLNRIKNDFSGPTNKSTNSALSEPDDATQFNSTGIEGRPLSESIQVSSIEERDFSSSFDDSFILRTKQFNAEDSESGFRSENTFSFGETENESPRGESAIMRLMRMGKERKENFFKFHVMEQKVTDQL